MAIPESPQCEVLALDAEGDAGGLCRQADVSRGTEERLMSGLDSETAEVTRVELRNTACRKALRDAVRGTKKPRETRNSRGWVAFLNTSPAGGTGPAAQIFSIAKKRRRISTQDFQYLLEHQFDGFYQY